MKPHFSNCLPLLAAAGLLPAALPLHAADTSLDRTELLRRSAWNVGEALRGEPGLAVASDGAQSQNPVILGLKKESVALKNLAEGVSGQEIKATGRSLALTSQGKF